MNDPASWAIRVSSATSWIAPLVKNTWDVTRRAVSSSTAAAIDSSGTWIPSGLGTNLTSKPSGRRERKWWPTVGQLMGLGPARAVKQIEGDPWCSAARAHLDELEARHGAAIGWRMPLKDRACRELLELQAAYEART